MSKEKTIKAYKGFNPDLTCRGYQYEVGESYELPETDVKVCEGGFHACESPLEVLDHYFFCEEGKMARFCEVEQSGKLDREENTTKIASSKIKIKAELKFADLIKLGVEWLKEKTMSSNIEDSNLSDKGIHKQNVGSSGDSAKIGSSGGSAKIGSSGGSAKIGSSGDYAQIGSSGDYAQINSTGEDSVICCAGHGSMAKAKQGSWITLAEWAYNRLNGRYVPKCVKTEFVDGERIKEDTWYHLVDGEFVEIQR